VNFPGRGKPKYEARILFGGESKRDVADKFGFEILKSEVKCPDPFVPDGSTCSGHVLPSSAGIFASAPERISWTDLFFQ
jgi:hypothetical protein